MKKERAIFPEGSQIHFKRKMAILLLLQRSREQLKNGPKIWHFMPEIIGVVVGASDRFRSV